MKNFWVFVGITIVAIVLAVVIWSYARAYDQKKPDVDPEITWEDTFRYVRVKVIGTAMGMYHDIGWHTRETFYGQQGSGFVAEEGFIFTAAHIIIPDKVHTPIGKSGVLVAKPFKILTRTILIYDFRSNPLIAKLHYIDRELDIAILTYEPNGILEPANYEIHYAQDMLKKGDVVFSYLHKRDEGRMTDNLEIKYGIVLANKPTTPKMGSGLSVFNPYDITISMEIQPGDSGSPLFALRDGKPIFIGIIRMLYYDEIVTLGYAVTLPNIKRYLKIAR